MNNDQIQIKSDLRGLLKSTPRAISEFWFQVSFTDVCECVCVCACVNLAIPVTSIHTHLTLKAHASMSEIKSETTEREVEEKCNQCIRRPRKAEKKER